MMIVDVFEIYFLKLYVTWMISQPLLPKACKPPVLQHRYSEEIMCVCVPYGSISYGISFYAKKAYSRRK